MHYALTINADQIITGVHESVTPILAGTFAATPELADDTVVTIPAPADYQIYTHILCYDEDGTLKDFVWCIENGYMELPPNKEIINGELVDKEIPAEEQPQTLKEYLDEQFGAVRQETEKTTSALKPLMTELVKGKPADIVIQTADFILPWKEGNYKLDDVCLWEGQPRRCCQPHDSTGNPDWTPALASLWAPYHGTAPETALPWIAPTGAHDMYKKGEWMVWTDGKTYECLSDTNYSPDDYAQAWREYVTEGVPADGGAPDPIEPEPETNSNGTDVWSEWVVWNNHPATLYKIGDRVTLDGIRYIATLDNNHWSPTSGTGWAVAPE